MTEKLHPGEKVEHPVEIYCLKCGQDSLHKHRQAMDIGTMLQRSAYYCVNQECEHFGVITVAIGTKVKT